MRPISRVSVLLMMASVHICVAWCTSRAVGRPLTVVFGRRGKKVRRLKQQAVQSPTPPLIKTPYGPIRLSTPLKLCVACQGRGQVRCDVCEGRGAIRATGTNKRNCIVVDRLIGSQWTSVEICNGHRQHTVVDVRGSPKRKKDMEVRLQNCCGEQQDFWIKIDELREKAVWRMGWQTLEDIRKANGGPLRDARLCFRCKGQRILPCGECDGVGEIPNFEPLYD